MRMLRGVVVVFLFCVASSIAWADPAIRIEASAKQADGRIVVVGQADYAAPGTMTMGRLNADGTMDASFGAGGWTTLTAAATSEFRATAIAASPSGDKIVAVAKLDGLLQLVRLDATGAPDTTLNGTGTAIDSQSAGFEPKALVVDDTGSMLVLGSYAGPDTSNVPQAALIAYLWDGSRNGAGMRLPQFSTGGSELYAAVADTYGVVYAVGYMRSSPGAEKDFLMAAFRMDTASMPDFGGAGFYPVNMQPGSDDEATAIGWGADGFLYVAGRDGRVRFDGSDESNLRMLRVCPHGEYSEEVLDYHIIIPATDRRDIGAFAQSVDAIPGTGDVLVGARATDQSGRVFFFTLRRHADGRTDWAAAPLTDADDLLNGAYANGTQYVAVGTRESTAGEAALRVRYFLDDFSVDTESPDTTPDQAPNAFEFPSQYADGPAITVGGDARITGINVATPISISNGEYRIEGAPGFTSAPGFVSNGQHISVRTVSAASASTSTTAVLTVGTAQFALTVTTTGLPETWIDGKPSNPGIGTATFTYGGASTYSDMLVDMLVGSTSAFECRLDGAPFVSCPPAGATFTSLASGSHTFEVRALNAWGADATPASYTWAVQLPAKVVIDSVPPSQANSSSATFAFTADEAGVTFSCRLDAQSWFACTSPTQYSGLSQGTHTFAVRATNASGDGPVAQATWTTDYTAPAASLAGSTSGASATFTFSSNDATAALQCSFDGAAFAACASPVALNVAEGAHMFRVRAVDLAGNGSAIQSYGWTYDVTPPDTSLWGGASGSVTSGTVTFSFGATESATFECRLDGAAWQPCTSPYSSSGLVQGAHTFEVRARDASGNVDATPASQSWTIVSPDTYIASGPPALTSSTSATFTFGSTDGFAAFECRVDGGPFVACPRSWTVSGLAEGAHTFDVRAVDATNPGSTPASWHWTIDLTPPETVILTQPYAVTALSNATFTLAANESGVSFQCRLDAGAWVSCQAGGVPYSNLSPGSHTFDAQAVDSAGNIDVTPATFTWTIDPGFGPDTTITSSPDGTTNTTNATIAFRSDKPNVTFDCTFSGTRSTCTSPVTLTGLADGSYTFIVGAIDSEGNMDRSPASVSWTVDTTAPDTTIATGPSGTTQVNSASLTFTSTDAAAGFECSLDDAAFVACVSGASYNALAEGMHMFKVRARDGAGNVDPTPASVTWSVDTTVPNTAITSGPPAINSSTTATFAFSATEAGTFLCVLDGGAAGECPTPVTYAALAQGPHSFAVYALDAAGNADASPAAWSWLVDSVAPDTTISAAPSGAVSQGSASISFSASEAGSTFQCSLDGAGFAACMSPASLTGLADGAHTFQARSIDAAGNVDATPAVASWTVDTVAPDTTITGGASGNNNPSTATFTFTSTESPSTFECRLDAGSLAACASPITYSNLARGSHTFQVRARDAAGNLDATPATRNWNSK